MSAGKSSVDQVRLNDDGELEIERTWDGEPLWSPATVAEGLFSPDAFEQMPGQLPIEEMGAVDAFNAHWDQVGSPEARAARAAERAEYEARYEAMQARKRAERES